MGKHVVDDCDVSVDGSDLSEHVSSVTIDQTKDDHEVTGMKANMKEHINGLPDGSMTLNFWQDYDAGSVDSVLQAAFDGDDPVPIIVTPHDAVVSPTNPSWTMQGLLQNYQPLAGAKGEPNATETTFQNGDPSGIVKGIAP